MSLRLSSVRRSTIRVPQQARARRRRRLWVLEGLEDRILLSGNPTVYTVTDTSDSATDTGSLPYAITQANANSNAAGSVIAFGFTTPQTITLSSTLVLSESAGPEVIDGPSAGVTISGNNAVGVFQVGGGVTATLTGLTISGGSATYGGGIFSDGALTVSGSTITGNLATYGGGISNFGMLTVSESTIASNTPTYEGGGIYNGGTVTVNSSTISDNSTGNYGAGGGIFNNGTLTMINSTVANNSAGYDAGGGGIWNGGTLTAVNTTIAYNSCFYQEEGGGLYDNLGSTATLDNTIVAVNTGIGGPDDINGAPASVSGQNDLVGVDNTGSLTNGTNGNLVIRTANPGLGLLAYNGGPTQTIVLRPGSPAIDAGSNALANEYSLTTDQRGAGFPRIVNGVVDVGAYELAAPTSTTLVSSANPSVYGQTITLTTTVAAGSAPTVYTVDLTSDTGASTGADAGDLAYVISQANMNPNLAGSVIQFAPTVFSASDPQTITLTSTLELGGPSGPMVIDGPGASAVTISGGGSVEVFQAEPGAVTTLSGLTVSGGSAINGGGIFVSYDSTLMITNSTIAGNSATIGYGGGLYTDGNVTVTNSTIEGNSAVEQIGGGICTSSLGTVTVIGSTIEGNSAPDGGGIYNRGGTVTVTGSTIEGNTGAGIGSAGGTTTITDSTIEDNYGGGISASGTLTLTDCTIEGNTVEYGGGGGVYATGTTTITGTTIAGNSGPGGGIYNVGTLTVDGSTIDGNSAATPFGGGGIENSGTLTVADCSIEDNFAGGGGGGIFSGGTLSIIDSTIAGNVAGTIYTNAVEGGGISNGGVLTVSGTMISDNKTTGGGGGMYNYPGSTMTVVDSTIADNQSGQLPDTVYGGGGINNQGTLTAVNTTIAYNYTDYDGGGVYDDPGSTTTLYNTVVAVNTGGDGPDDIAGAGVSSASAYNLVGVDETGSLTNGTDGNQVDVTSPGLASGLADNGGPTQTIALLAGSPAIDAGSNALAVDPSTSLPLITDQRGGGYARIVNGTVDIGAFEVQAAPVATTTTTLSSLADPSVFGQSVTFTASVTASSGTPAGTVQFLIDGTDFGSPVTLVSGSATSPAISSLTVASHTIEAVYSGGTNFAASTGTLTQMVNPVSTSTGSVPPTGSVTFYVGAVNSADEIGTGTLSTNSNGVTTTTFSTHSLPAGTYAITAVYGGNTNYPASTSNVVTQTINPAPLTITANNQAKVYGQTNPAPTVSYSGFVNGDSSASLTTGPTITTTATTTSPVGSYAITASGASDSNYTISYVAGTLTISPDATTTVANSSATSTGFGQSVTLSATVTANAPGSGTPTGTVDFFDTTTGDDLGSVTLSGGEASLSTASLPVGSNAIKVTYSGSGNFLTSSASTGTITINQSIIVLDPTAGGALTLSGNASIKLTGGVFVDSSSSTALSASGNAAIKASVIDVHGGVQKSGNASFSPTPTTGAATLPDPLASLPEPSTSGLTSYGSETLSGNSSATIKPGIYSQIAVSENASLTLNSGLYIIEGGGLSVSGNASIIGSGVTIFNAGSKYSTTGGTYGAITLSGNGSYKLSPPTTGTYAGIVIFQSRDNTEALTLSGNASGMTGTIYALSAQLAESGNAQLNAAIVVDTLTVSGNGVANIVTLNAPSGTVAYTPNQIRDAYGISELGAGFPTPPLDGTGQTIAIVDAYDDPDIDQALDDFDSQFTLTDSGPTLYDQYGPASSFLTVLNQYGQATSLPSTDPNGPGTDNWEVEESLDVEWAHAIAPGAQIILVEANSSSLSDLMASVATAASQPGVSVVSMSWGFPEGQSVFASDEATYDSYFDVPGVTFVASTGDYGAVDPEYPAFSPNVVAVGGTSLTLNVDNSYNSETGWGYQSDSVGAFIGSGGGISLYEPEPAYQQGVQSTGYRTTPDVSLVADPATGAWIADPYNLDPSNPFETVGGTSFSAPAWAGLLALINQGRAAAGESTLNSSTPTDTQQALYTLPQSDYNAIASGNNGYSAGAGYNLVTGLGTPVANLLVPDLIKYQGSGTTYFGPTVGPLQNVTLTNTGATSSSPSDVFSVFDSLTVARSGFGSVVDVGRGSVSGSTGSEATPDLVISDPPGGVDLGPGLTTAGRATSMMPLDIATLDAVLIDWSRTRPAVTTGATASASSVRGSSLTTPAPSVPVGPRRRVVQVAQSRSRRILGSRDLIQEIGS